MCKFMSFLGFANGDFFHASDCTDSHEVLIRAAKVNDGITSAMRSAFFRGEFTPPKDTRTISDLSTWRLRVDEDAIPEWCDWDKTRSWCERQVSQIIIRDKRGTVLGGCWILDGENASIAELANGRIVAVVNGANLAGAILARANLEGATLAGANLAGAILAGANLEGANLARAILAGANLARAILAGANLAGTTLYGATLYGANLARAILAGANLAGTTLYGATLYGANLARATLAGANLEGANLEGANLSVDQPLPPGWKRLDSGVVVRSE